MPSFGRHIVACCAGPERGRVVDGCAVAFSGLRHGRTWVGRWDLLRPRPVSSLVYGCFQVRIIVRLINARHFVVIVCVWLFTF